ncbi:MAG: radical SAM protein [Candidatus Methanoperedenaceae archaeon]|nr:MAG: radical SAM protein [Candidatus Methanoperedenaceae archaeon]
MSNKFKILLVYPNLQMINLLPSNISILAACLKQKGFDVELFDTTFYKIEEKSVDEKRVEILQLRPFNLSRYGIQYKDTDVYDDFRKKVESYKPDLIAPTIVDDTLDLTINLLKTIHDLEIPVCAGGVHTIFAPESSLSHDEIDYVCWGEGEEALPELCQHLKEGASVEKIQNIWSKSNGKILRKGMRGLVDLDKLPYNDFSLFEEKRFFRPMQGKVYRMVPVEIDRGCPYSCKFCAAPYLRKLYKKETGCNYYRMKSPDRVINEIKHYIDKYNAEYIYFNSETFLAMSEEKFDYFAREYISEIHIPFWCQSRVETISDFKISRLAQMGCDRISIGLEHGNEEFRKKILNKTFTNVQAIDAFKTIRKYSIPITVNNMIGFPDETREMVFDTINLNRELYADSINAYIFVPYHGTELREIALKKGYLKKDTRTHSLINPTLDMPQLSRKSIEGLLRTFPLYVKMPKNMYDEIRIAEHFTEEGNAVIAQLAIEYAKKYW